MTSLQFEEAIRQLMPSPVEIPNDFRFVFRNVAQRYATRSACVSFAGSVINTGRYHIGSRYGGRELNPGELGGYRFGVLYLSFSIYGCLAELEYYATKSPSHSTLDESICHGLPRTFVGIKVVADKILDLSDGDVLDSLCITEADLLEEWEIVNYDFDIAKTQIIGKVAKEKGFIALIAPSARWDGGKTLNILDTSLPIEVINVGELND